MEERKERGMNPFNRFRSHTLGFLFVWIFILIFGGCQREEGGKESIQHSAIPIQHSEFPAPPLEDLEGFSLYLLKKRGLEVIHLENDRKVKEIPIPEDLKEGSFSSDGQTLYLLGRGTMFPFHLAEGKILKKSRVKVEPHLVLVNPRGAEIFILSQEGILSIYRPLRVVQPRFEESDTVEEIRSITLSGKPVKFLISPNGLSLWIACEGALFQVNWQDGKVLQKKETPLPIDLLLGPYDGKIYWLGEKKLVILDLNTLQSVKEFKIKGTPKGLRLTPAGNKLYLLFEKEIWVMRTASLRMESKIRLEGKFLDLLISPDGSFAFAMTESESEGIHLQILDLGLDRILTSIPVLPFTISNLKSEIGNPKIVYTPQGSRLYLLADSLYRVDVEKRKISSIQPVKEGISLLINPVPIAPLPKEEIKVVEKVSVERDVFTIQVSSHLEAKAAESGLLRLRSYGFPAYIVTTETSEGIWHRLRVGGFSSRGEGEAIAEKIGKILKQHLWVTRARIDPSVLPQIPVSGRDLNGDGKREEVVLSEGRKIRIFTLDRGFFQKLFEIKKDKETYRGEPEFKDMNGDGTPEIVTPLLLGDSLSVIDWGEGGFFERTISK